MVKILLSSPNENPNKTIINMKRALMLTSISLISILMISSCATFQPDFYENTPYNIDLSKYQKEGLFITTGDFYSKYDPVSILTESCYNGYISKQSTRKRQAENQTDNDSVYSEGSSFNLKDFEYKNCLISDLLDYLFESAKEMGANGIINLEIKSVVRTSPDSEKTQDGALVTGLAIKY